MRVKVKRMMGRLLSSSVAGVFFNWLDALDEKKRMQEAGKKVMKRLLNAAIASAFNSWSEMWRQNKVCRKILKRVTNQLMASMFNEWAYKIANDKNVSTKSTIISTKSTVLARCFGLSMAHFDAGACEADADHKAFRAQRVRTVLLHVARERH